MPSLDEFIFIATHAPYQLFRYAMDWDKQTEPDAIRKWEEREEGSLKSVLDAYAFVIPSVINSKPITINHIKEIHKICSAHLKVKWNPGEFREGLPVYFKVTKKTSTEAGLKELVFKDRQYPCHLFNLFYSKSRRDKNQFYDDEYEDKTYTDEEKLAILKSHIPFSFYGYDGRLSLDELKETFAIFQLQQTMDLNGGSIDSISSEMQSRFTQLKEKFQKNLTEEIENTLTEFYKKVETTDENMKLTAIAKTIQHIEHLHPFYDCNCRTLCVILLNTLLMQHGFPPALIDDPNKFDGYSIKELVIMMREGIKRTEELCHYVMKESENPTIFSIPLEHDSSNSEKGPEEVDTQNEAQDNIKFPNEWQYVPPTQRKELNYFAELLTSKLVNKQPCQLNCNRFFVKAEDSPSSHLRRSISWENLSEPGEEEDDNLWENEGKTPSN